MTTTTYQVTGMSCGHCETSVRSEVAQIPGITDVAVNASDGSLVITSGSPVDEAAVIAAVEEAGYQAERVR